MYFVFLFFWLKKFMQMYFQWNIISPEKSKIFSWHYRLPMVKTIHVKPNSCKARNTSDCFFFVSSSDSTSLLYGNVKTISEREICEKRWYFFHLLLNNITYDSRGKKIEPEEGIVDFCTRKKKEKRKINQIVHTSFVSFDWQSTIDKQSLARWSF